MKNNVVIVVPSLESTSPVRGSFALANILIKHKKVFIVSLRDDKLNSDVYINEKIRFSIQPEKNLTIKLDKIPEMLSLPHSLQKDLKSYLTALLSS